MRLPRVRFTVRRMMGGVAVASLILVALPLTRGTRQYQAVCPPPQVEGEVAWVDSTNERVLLTIGSDDGLVQGVELYGFRNDPKSRFLGKIRIVYIDDDRSVGQVIGVWNKPGSPIRKGDKVALYPR
ncbi:MAG: hypothetical protein NVSMB9_36210 [Isosphaeraceae bacterium]